MIRIEGHRIIRAPVHKVFQLVSRLDTHPQVTGLWLSADLLERRPNAMTVHYKGYFGGIPMESVQRATLHPPQQIEFKQSRGGLKSYSGRYALKPVDGDTELSLQVEAEVGIALITDASAERVLQAYVERSLQKFKFLAERDLPRVVRHKQEEAAAPIVAPPTPPPAVPPAPPPAAPTSSAAPSTEAPGSRRRPRRRRRRRRGGQQQTSGQGAANKGQKK